MRKFIDSFKSGLAFPWRGLNLQLIAILILPLTAIVVAITFGSMSLHQKAMRDLVGERDERAARTAASALGDHLRYRLLLIQSLSGRAKTAETDDLEQILAASADLLAEFDGGLAFFSEDGSLLAAIGDLSLWENYARVKGSGAPAASALLSPQVSLTPVVAHPVSGEKMVLIRVVDPERHWATVGAFSIVPLATKTLASAFNGPDQTSAFLVDDNYQLLYHFGNRLPATPLETYPGVREALRGESGTTFLSTDGLKQVIAFSPVNFTGWALILEEPWEAVTNPLLRTTGSAPLVLVPVLLLALVALLFGARQIVKPLQALEAQAARLSWGDFQAIEEPVGGVAEIRHLQRELIHLAQKVQSAQKSLHSYIGAITTGQEEERRRLARELHDDTLQSLIALKQRVQLANMNSQNEVASKSLNEIETLAEETIGNLRRLTRALRPIYLEDLGLVAALEMLAREMGQVTGFAVEFRCHGVERRLSPAAELALYRIAQEAVSNVARHAEARQAMVSIAFSSHTVKLEVADAGKGFEIPKSPADFAPGGHFGLLGMYERAELIGADLGIQSSPEDGTRVVVGLET